MVAPCNASRCSADLDEKCDKLVPNAAAAKETGSGLAPVSSMRSTAAVGLRYVCDLCRMRLCRTAVTVGVARYAGARPVFIQVDALPCAKCEAALGYG